MRPAAQPIDTWNSVAVVVERSVTPAGSMKLPVRLYAYLTQRGADGSPEVPGRISSTHSVRTPDHGVTLAYAFRIVDKAGTAAYLQATAAIEETCAAYNLGRVAWVDVLTAVGGAA